MAGLIAAASRPDAGAFLSRLLRMDGTAVVRLRPLPPGGPAPTSGVVPVHSASPAGRVVIWARLPFGVLVARGLRAAIENDVTVRARDLLDAVRDDTGLPARYDSDWRWPLPSSAGEEIESVPAAEVHRLAAAAADTARTALGEGIDGRAVGSRRLRDALLDHVPIVVDTAGGQVDVPQRLVQAVVRMGFVGEPPVSVRRAGQWVGLAGVFGAAWHRSIGESLNLHVSPYRSNG